MEVVSNSKEEVEDGKDKLGEVKGGKKKKAKRKHGKEKGKDKSKDTKDMLKVPKDKSEKSKDGGKRSMDIFRRKKGGSYIGRKPAGTEEKKKEKWPDPLSHSSPDPPTFATPRADGSPLNKKRGVFGLSLFKAFRREESPLGANQQNPEAPVWRGRQTSLSFSCPSLVDYSYQKNAKGPDSAREQKTTSQVLDLATAVSPKERRPKVDNDKDRVIDSICIEKKSKIRAKKESKGKHKKERKKKKRNKEKKSGGLKREGSARKEIEAQTTQVPADSSGLSEPSEKLSKNSELEASQGEDTNSFWTEGADTEEKGGDDSGDEPEQETETNDDSEPSSHDRKKGLRWRINSPRPRREGKNEGPLASPSARDRVKAVNLEASDIEGEMIIIDPDEEVADQTENIMIDSVDSLRVKKKGKIRRAGTMFPRKITMKEDERLSSEGPKGSPSEQVDITPSSRGWKTKKTTDTTEAPNPLLLEQLTQHLLTKGKEELSIPFPVGDADAAFVVARLMRQSSIRSIYVNSCPMGDEGAKEFAHMLKRNELGVKRLVLAKKDVTSSKREMAGRGVLKLGRSLEVNTTLLHLDLSYNMIGQKGMLAIAESLAYNTTLKTLDLSGNTVTLPIAEAFGTALAHNFRLKKLILKNCKMTIEGLMRLLSCLRFNRTLVSLSVPQTSVLPKLKMQKVLSWVSMNRWISALDLGSLEKVGFSVLRMELERNNGIQMQMKSWKGINEPRLLTSSHRMSTNQLSMSQGWVGEGSKESPEFEESGNIPESADSIPSRWVSPTTYGLYGDPAVTWSGDSAELSTDDEMVTERVGTSDILDRRSGGRKPHLSREFYSSVSDAINTHEGGVKGKASITVIHLRKANLPFIPSIIYGLTHLRELVLTDNNLLSISPEIGQLKHLSLLYLNRNKISSLPAEVSRLSKLEIIDCSYNNFESLPASVVQIRGLDTLIFHHNVLRELSDDLYLLRETLVTLDVSFNKLSRLPPFLHRLTKLTMFNIRNNRFSVFPSSPLSYFSNDTPSSSPEGPTVSEPHMIRTSSAINPPKVTTNTEKHKRIRSMGMSARGLVVHIPHSPSFSNLALSPTNNVLPFTDATIREEIGEDVYLPPNLQQLNLCCNSLQYVPFAISCYPALQRLELRSNPLITIPKSLKSGSSVQLFEYLASMEKLCKNFSTVRLMALGEDKVGKTSLLNGLTRSQLARGWSSQSLFGLKRTESAHDVSSDTSQGNTSETHRLGSIYVHKWSHRGIDFSTWDLTDEDVYQETYQFFASGNHTIYLLVFNLASDDASKLDFWLCSLASRGGSSKPSSWPPVIVVGTQSGEEFWNKDVVNHLLDRWKQKYAHYPNIKKWLVVPHQPKGKGKGKWVKELRSAIIEVASAHSMVGCKISPSYLHLMKYVHAKRKLLQEENKPPVLVWSELEEEALTNLNISSFEFADAIRFLNSIGELVYLEDNDPSKSMAPRRRLRTGSLNRSGGNSVPVLVENAIFLDPQWLSDIFASVVSAVGDERVFKDGVLNHKQSGLIWPKIPSSLIPLCLAVLQKFNIIYPLPAEKGHEECSVVPALLPQERPPIFKELWANLDDIKVTNSVTDIQVLNREYRFKSLPLGFFGRLIVRTSHLIAKGLAQLVCCWRNGMILAGNQKSFEYDQQARALLKYNTSLYQLNVRICYQGNKQSKFMELVLDNIKTLIDCWYKSEVNEVSINCIHCLARQSGYRYDPFVFTLSGIELTAAQGKRYAYCRGIRPVRIDKLAPDVDMTYVAQIKREDVEIGEKIGEGGYAIVYKGRYNSKDVAVKHIKFVPRGIESENSTLVETFGEFRREVLMMNGLEHPNLVMLEGMCLESNANGLLNDMLIITEFVPLGDLYHYIHNPQNSLDWELRLRIATDIALGMDFLHAAVPPIIHNDLKSPNIFLVTSEPHAPVVAQVADFGLSSMSIHSMKGRTVHNPNWLAPEIMMRDTEYTERADVYSYAMILWELYHRAVPFDCYDFGFSRILEEKIIHEKLRPPIASDCPPAYAELITHCWDADPELRPSFSEILNKLRDLREIVAPGLREVELFPPLRQRRDSISEREATGEVRSKRRRLARPSILTPAVQTPVQLYSKHALEMPGSVHCLLGIPAINEIWAGCGAGGLICIDIPTRTIKRQVMSQGAVNTMCADGNNVYTVSKDKIVTWDIEQLKPIREAKVHATIGAALAVGKDLWCGACGARDEIQVRSLKNCKMRKVLPMDFGPAACLLGVNNRVWVGSFKAIVVFNAMTLEKEGYSEGHEAIIHSLILVNDYIWSCSSDKTIGIWDQRAQLLKVLEGHQSRVFTLLHYGDCVWSGSWDKSIMIWDAKTREFVQELKENQKDAISAMIEVNNGSNGKEVWSGSWDNSICIYSKAGPSTAVGQQKKEDPLIEKLAKMPVMDALQEIYKDRNLRAVFRKFLDQRQLGAHLDLLETVESFHSTKNEAVRRAKAREMLNQFQIVSAHPQDMIMKGEEEEELITKGEVSTPSTVKIEKLQLKATLCLRAVFKVERPVPADLFNDVQKEVLNHLASEYLSAFLQSDVLIKHSRAEQQRIQTG